MGTPLWMLSGDPEMTAERAALALGITMRELRQWADEGRLSVRVLGPRSRRYRRAEVAVLAALRDGAE